MSLYDKILGKGVQEMSGSIAYLVTKPYYKHKALELSEQGENNFRLYESTNDKKYLSCAENLFLKSIEYAVDEHKLEIISILISVYIKSGEESKAHELFESMRTLPLSNFTKTAILKEYDDPTGFKSIYRLGKVVITGKGYTNQELLNIRTNEYELYKDKLIMSLDNLFWESKNNKSSY